MITDQLKRRVPGDGTEQEFTKEVVSARVSIPVSVPINTRNGIDDLQSVDIKCGQTSIKAVINTGAQISALSKDLIGKGCGESTKDKDLEFKKEKEELRKEMEDETRKREARHKEEEQARLKAEVEARHKAEEETKTVEERRRIEEERRMNERIALEEEMRLEKERWLVEEQIRHVQEEHKMRMKEEQKCLPEERCKKTDGEAIVFKSEPAQILSVDPDIVAQPVAVEEEKGLSRDSSNVPPISAEDETYELKEKPKFPN
ncbi:hypothetical protein TNCV_4297971 [Trichonephila clavipes]|nr:hypothetical protein TNCV_4297971 [Trichonephila clavipes]